MKHPKPAVPKAFSAHTQADDNHQHLTNSKPTPITAAAAWADAPAISPRAAKVSKRPKLPALFISHGAPTLAIEQSATTSALARMGQNLPKPRAIVIMSAHWQSAKLEISSNPQPKTWHDFSGFASELYELQYPAAGQPALAETLAHQLTARGITCRVNPLSFIRPHKSQVVSLISDVQGRHPRQQDHQHRPVTRCHPPRRTRRRDKSGTAAGRG